MSDHDFRFGVNSSIGLPPEPPGEDDLLEVEWAVKSIPGMSELGIWDKCTFGHGRVRLALRQLERDGKIKRVRGKPANTLPNPLPNRLEEDIYFPVIKRAEVRRVHDE
jgi:hypothetical protein